MVPLHAGDMVPMDSCDIEYIRYVGYIVHQRNIPPANWINHKEKTRKVEGGKVKLEI